METDVAWNRLTNNNLTKSLLTELTTNLKVVRMTNNHSTIVAMSINPMIPTKLTKAMLVRAIRAAVMEKAVAMSNEPSKAMGKAAMASVTRSPNHDDL